MYNLSLTACSFHFRKANSIGNTQIYNLNEPLCIKNNDDKEFNFNDLSELFTLFFNNHENTMKDKTKQQSFRCEYLPDKKTETQDFRMFCVRIYSGNYGSASDIIDGNTAKVKYKKKFSDIDIRPFYLMVVFPKDNEKVVVQKGMLLFQNIGQFGIKTITTSLMKNFFSSEFNITLKCNTIAPDLFIRKIIRRDTIKKFVMVKNVKSSDLSDNINIGYGSEVREIGKLYFTESMWGKMMGQIQHVAGGKNNIFEFEQKEYDNLKVVVDVGGRTRTISLHNLESLSIIEAIPDEIRMADGHPDILKLIDYFKDIATEYLEEMVLQIA